MNTLGVPKDVISQLVACIHRRCIVVHGERGEISTALYLVSVVFVLQCSDSRL